MKHFEKYGIDDKKIERMEGNIEVKMKKRQQKYIEKKFKDY
jgi:hypothetical protein